MFQMSAQAKEKHEIGRFEAYSQKRASKALSFACLAWVEASPEKAYYKVKLNFLLVLSDRQTNNRPILRRMCALFLPISIPVSKNIVIDVFSGVALRGTLGAHLIGLFM